MSEGKKLKLLSDIFGSYYRSKNEILFFCPRCDHRKKKLSINIEKNAFKCWVCDYSGHSLYRLVRSYGNYEQRAVWSKYTRTIDIVSFEEKLFPSQVEKKEQKIPLPGEFISLANKNLPYSSLYPLHYLKTRGILKEDIVRWKIGYCAEGKFKNRIIIPSFGLSGYCNYFIARSYTDDWRKYLNPPISRDIIFNHLFLDFDSELVVVEGAFDAIVAGKNAVSLLGSTMRENSVLFQEIVKNDTPIYIALDSDAEKKAMTLINNLLSYDIEIKKINIFPFSDVGEMTKEEFSKRMFEAEIMNKDNYLLRQITGVQ